MALRKVRVRALPAIKKEGLGTSGNLIYPIYKPNMMAQPDIQDNDTLKPVPREDSNLEAEKGETAYIPDADGLAAHFKIGGKRHSEGGTPLNLPDDSFIFSDTAKMKIKDPNIMQMFGKNGNTKMTPADIAKQYDINTFRKTLADKTITDPWQIKTAEMMIANYNLKLGKLALVQEASKGFPQGVPAVALPYIAHMAISPQDVLPLKGSPSQPSLPGSPNQPQTPAPGAMEMGGPKKYPYSFHGGPQDWANAGNALMQDGGPTWFDRAKDVLNAPSKALTYVEESLPYAIDYAMGHGNRLHPKYEFLSDYYNRVQNAMDPNAEHTPRLGPNSSAVMNIVSDPQTYLGMRGTAQGAYNIAKPVVTGVAKGAAALAGLTMEQIRNLMNLYKVGSFKDLAVAFGKVAGTAAERVAPALAKLPSDQQSATPDLAHSPFRPYTPVPNPLEMPAQTHQAPPTAAPSRSLNVSNLTDAQIDSIIGTKKAYGGPVMQAGGDIVAQALAEKERRRRLNTTSSAPSAPAKKPMSKVDVYQEDYINELMKKQGDKNLKSRLPAYLNDQSLSSKVNEIQSKNKGSFGAQDWWGDPALKQDFMNRHSWYFKDHPNWDPSVPGQVKDFQQSYNDYAKKKGMTRNYFVNNSNSPWSVDDKLGQMTYSAPALDPVAKLATPRYDQTSKGVPPLDTNYSPDTYHEPGQAPWFLQDVVKTAGAAGDFSRIHKYLPWAPKVTPVVPTPTFYDPTRELEANQEAANLTTQGARAYGDPRLYAATAAHIQGNAAEAAANVLGKYNNMNVGEANRFAGMQADVMNRANEANAATATSLYDKTTAANQNFDNAKAMARQNLRSSYIDAVTNRANAQVLNTMYPNYHIDPTTGGMLDFYKGTPLKGTLPRTQAQDVLDYYNSLKAADPTLQLRDVIKGKEFSRGEFEGETPSQAPYRYPGT